MTQIKIKDDDGNIIEAKLLYSDNDILHFEVEGMSTEYLKNQTDIFSFPKTKPKCCGKEMLAAGGTLGREINENSQRFWLCESCKQEIIDIPS